MRDLASLGPSWSMRRRAPDWHEAGVLVGENHIRDGAPSFHGNRMGEVSSSSSPVNGRVTGSGSWTGECDRVGTLGRGLDELTLRRMLQLRLRPWYKQPRPRWQTRGSMVP